MLDGGRVEEDGLYTWVLGGYGTGLSTNTGVFGWLDGSGRFQRGVFGWLDGSGGVNGWYS